MRKKIHMFIMLSFAMLFLFTVRINVYASSDNLEKGYSTFALTEKESVKTFYYYINSSEGEQLMRVKAMVHIVYSQADNYARIINVAYTFYGKGEDDFRGDLDIEDNYAELDVCFWDKICAVLKFKVSSNGYVKYEVAEN